MMHVHDVVKEGYTIKVFLSRCNCKCFTCPYKFVLDRSSIPKYSNIKQIAKKIQTLMSGSKSYYLEFTGGEPMMVWEDIIKMLDSLSTVAADIFVRVRTNGTMSVNPFVEAYNKCDFARSNQLFVRHCDLVFHIPTPTDDEYAADIAINMETGIPNFAGRKRLNCEEGVNFIRFSDESWNENQSYIQNLLDKLDQSKVRYQVLNH